MIDAVLDIEVLKRFFLSKPTRDITEDLDSWEEWESLYKFLKRESNIHLPINMLNVNHQNNFIGALTTGRGKSKVNDIEKKEFNKTQTVFFIEEKFKEELGLNKEIERLAIANSANIYDVWKKISFRNKKTNFFINNRDNRFESWRKINQYITAITDVVLVDAYIFKAEREIIEANLYVIMESLSTKVKNKINLTIITNYHKDVDISEQYNEILKFIKKRKLKINISIVAIPVYQRIHDRNIYTNYFSINSGQSLNYFKPDGQLNIRETRLQIETYCRAETHNVVSKQLNMIREKVQFVFNGNHRASNIMGNPFKNRLLFPPKHTNHSKT